MQSAKTLVLEQVVRTVTVLAWHALVLEQVVRTVTVLAWHALTSIIP
jgi:hypothetical protein